MSGPHVTLHYAQTLDGRIAARDGSSRWIGGEESRRFAHGLRASHDAVLVGVGTIRADDPQLTVRLVPGRSPTRVVLDSVLSVPLGARVLSDGAAPTIVVTTARADPLRAEAIRERGADVLVVPQDAEGRVDLLEALRALAERGLRSILVEGGAAVITAALRSRVVDRLVVCVAPKVLGSGAIAVGDLGVARLGDAIVLREVRVTSCGEDVIVDGVFERVGVPA